MKKFYSSAAVLRAAAVLLFFSGCSRSAAVSKFEGFALGTVYSVTVVGESDGTLQAQIDDVFAYADSTMSVFNPNSLLSRINRNETDSLNSDLVRNIELALEVGQLSGGKYDITIQPLVEAYGFIDERQQPLAIDSLLEYVGYEKISVSDGRLVKESPEIRLDLNSIAKGYVVDMIAGMLESEGIDNYLVNVGGEIFCRGTNASGDRWRIAIDTPYEGNYLPGASTSTVLSVSGMGVATSGNYRNFRVGADGRKYTHIIDPITGANTESSLLSATVIASDCAQADALATMFMVMGLDGSVALLGQHHDIAALLIYDTADDGMKIFVSPAMKQYM